ncbi:MAG: MFS transporter [Pelolinea sp.]|nr:MFS transporter [Pelolinea sp.]
MTKIFSSYLNNIKSFNRNIKLYLLTLFIINLGFGAFQADFNLYILAMGMTPAFLGIILSLTPFADAIAAIPVGFLAEKIGFKRGLLFVNLIVGGAYFLQIITPNRTVIAVAAFLIGLVACGNFIIQLPFVSHYAGENNKNQAYTLLSLVFYIGNSIGALIGGSVVGWITAIFSNEVTAYRLILAVFSLVIIAGCVPLLFMEDDKPSGQTKISLSPYLKGVDANTIKFALVELFVGFGLAFIALFLNVIFVYYFNSSVEMYGVMSVVALVPIIFFLFTGPSIAEKITGIKVVFISRFLSIFLTLGVVLTQNVFIGSGLFILYRAIFGLAQSLWFSYAISKATRRSRMATAVWLEIAFQIGLGIAALVGGRLVASGSYLMLGILSSAATAISFLLTYIFFGKKEAQLKA